MTGKLKVKSLGNGNYTIDDDEKTIAIVTCQGFIDWLIIEPGQPGKKITKLYKETHLSYTLGFKMELRTQGPRTLLRRLTYEVAPDGSDVRLHASCESPDRKFASTTDARLYLGGDGRYRWDMETSIQNLSDKPFDGTGIEYNNVYPSRAGLCMLNAPTKEYNATLMTDRNGAVWSFPHQHTLHYSAKINQLEFAEGSVAGFAGEPGGNPSVIVTRATHRPSWAICDMYFDLHCCCWLDAPLAPGEAVRTAYTVRYLTPAESLEMDARATPIPITAEDWIVHECPRIELGMNRFNSRCEIDKLDDSSCFRPRPPKLVWDREVGHVSRGSLRVSNDVAEETIWTAEPPTNIPPATNLGITGRIKTENVTGKGALIRVRYFAFTWHPEPHVEYFRDLESPPITGTTDGWIQVTVPSLRVEPEELDYLVSLHVVLDGSGVAWFTDVDVDLVESLVLDPLVNATKPLTTV